MPGIQGTWDSHGMTLSLPCLPAASGLGAEALSTGSLASQHSGTEDLLSSDGTSRPIGNSGMHSLISEIQE